LRRGSVFRAFRLVKRHGHFVTVARGACLSRNRDREGADEWWNEIAGAHN
jgi:hypothetical protein